MSDEQLLRKQQVKKLAIICIAMAMVSIAILVWSFQQFESYDLYVSDKAREKTLAAQVNSLRSSNESMSATIEENGKELVSFDEDRIKYVNLASDLSLQTGVQINRITVSDIIDEGEMTYMNTKIEIEGMIPDIARFIFKYCGGNNANRINVVSCRPSGRYAWLDRGIDGQKVMAWFDLSEDERIYEEFLKDIRREEIKEASEFDIPVEGLNSEDSGLDIITLDKMFATEPAKVYMSIDFLGRG